jgi:hypothetical protein
MQTRRITGSSTCWATTTAKSGCCSSTLELDRLRADRPSTASPPPSAMTSSAAWEESMRVMLKKVVQNLEAATHETKRLQEPLRTRKRQPTLVTLADVKKALIEDEVISREAIRD